MSGRLLFLSHRIPYPPDKGEKIRAWHLLDHLAARHEVELGCLVDDPVDLDHVATLRQRCAVVQARPALNRLGIAARALLRVRPGLPLSLGWFHDAALSHWVRAGLDQGRYDAVFVFSSAMAPYAMSRQAGTRPPLRVLDMVDVDSEKWLAYAGQARPPMAQVWRREARTLLAFERRAALDFDRTLFVSEAEARRFTALAPECEGRIAWVENGVDLTRFDPDATWEDPFTSGEPAVIFTGTMSYRPNIEAVAWFAHQVMPMLRTRSPAPRFHIVGARPSPAVSALAALPGVSVHGAVPDMRPYLAHAAVAVAPLKIARGIQNKVLEAMAMACPVVASPEAHEGVHAVAGRDLLVARDASEVAAAVAGILDGDHPGLGRAGRAAVTAGHDWAATLRRLDDVMAAGDA